MWFKDRNDTPNPFFFNPSPFSPLFNPSLFSTLLINLGGHLDVVQLLVKEGADIDSQDNRKMSCLLAAFRKGHVKVVRWMVKHVNQFPSDAECLRFISTISDKVT